MKIVHQLALTALLVTLFAMPTTAQTTSLRGSATTPPYKVGDYYNEDGFEGVVFEVSEDGTSGKIVSLTQSKFARQWRAYRNEGGPRATLLPYLSAEDQQDGELNCDIIKRHDDWQREFPAIAWCIKLGEGWYLPAINELKHLLTYMDIYTPVNKTLTTLGATTFPAKGTFVDYWSSTERPFTYGDGRYCAWGVNLKNGVTNDSAQNYYAFARAVAKFPASTREAHRHSYTTTAPYKVGDYYNDGIKEGIVFNINAEGNHGKIISLQQSSERLAWAHDDLLTTSVGAKSRNDGKANQAKVASRAGWQEQYPAFAWCRALGDDWYLPSEEELLLIITNKSIYEAINAGLHTMHSVPLYPIGTMIGYWSSTEHSSSEVKSVNLLNSVLLPMSKDNENIVRAIACF